MFRVFLALVVAGAATGVAHADDGMYFSQAVGVGTATGELAPTVGRTLRTRASIGARVRWLAVESWITSDSQTDRDGAVLGFFGGDPATGRSDLEHYGIDLRAIAPLLRSPDVTIEGYIRTGASLVSATGALEGYRGYGFGVAGGVQLRGKVRALGLLWSPLFFMKRGPKITAALYVDHGYELVRLRMASERPIAARVSHLSLGFAIGKTF